MPRYHFNVKDGIDIPDPVGTELPDIYAARIEAVRFSGDILRTHADKFWIQHEWRIEITDESGLILFAIHISAIEAPSLKDWRTAPAPSA